MEKKQAIKLAESKFWEKMNYKDIAIFQLSEPLLCMPFSVFHEAVEKALCRTIYTHEFAFGGSERMLAELRGEREKPTFSDRCATWGKT